MSKVADRRNRDHGLASYGAKAALPCFPVARAAGSDVAGHSASRSPLSPMPLKAAGNLYFSRWAAGYAIPAMIVAEDLQLLWSNPAADAIFAAGKDFQVINGVVGCVDKVQGQEFRAFLALVGDDPEAWIYCRDETAQQMVRAEVVRPDGLPRAVALMIYPIDSEDRFLWSDFHKMFGLTRAETVVVKRIVGGESADAIAEDLSVTLDTIRTHVRRVYTKLGVNNREQLFSRVSVFRIR